MLPIGGTTVLESIIFSLLKVVDDVVVVTGHAPDQIETIAAHHHCRVIHNPDYDRGMTTSFKAGLRASEADAVLLVLGDQVCLNPGTLNRMISAMEGDPTVLLVSPTYGGKRGHPTLIRSPLFDEFLSLADDGVMRDVVLRHACSHRDIEGDEWCITDMDTPEDYEIVLKKIGALCGNRFSSSEG